MDYTPPDITSILGIVDTFIRLSDEQTRGHRQYHKYHPSEWGKCLRSQQYKHYAQLGHIDEAHETHSSQKLRLFQKGHNMQSRWEDYFTAVNILRGRWKCKNPICLSFNDDGSLKDISLEDRQKISKTGKTRVHGMDNKCGDFKPDYCACGGSDFKYCEVPVIDEELNFNGHADCILDFSRFDPTLLKGVRPTFNIETLPKKPIVIDMKTAGQWAWDKQVKKAGLHSYYRIQILIYAHILDCEYGCVIYENKNDSSVAAFKVEKDEELFEIIRSQSKLMQKMADKQLLPPPRPEDKNVFECKNCPFKTVCHKSKIWSDPQLSEKRRRFYGKLL